MHFIAPGGQALGHQVAGGELLEGQFGMGMQVMAQGHHLGLRGTNAGKHRIGGFGRGGNGRVNVHARSLGSVGSGRKTASACPARHCLSSPGMRRSQQWQGWRPWHETCKIGP